MLNRKPRSGRMTAGALVKLADAVGAAKGRGIRSAIIRAERALAAFRNKLTIEENRRLADYLNRHEPATSASAILVGEN